MDSIQEDITKQENTAEIEDEAYLQEIFGTTYDFDCESIDESEDFNISNEKFNDSDSDLETVRTTDIQLRNRAVQFSQSLIETNTVDNESPSTSSSGLNNHSTARRSQSTSKRLREGKQQFH